MRHFITIVAFVLVVLTVPAAARAETITIPDSADAYVRAQDPGTNYGSADFIDSYGGSDWYTCGSDGQQPGAAYAYLKFNLSAIPAGAVIDDASLQLTSRTGFAWDGDPSQHIRFVGDDAWTETGITYATAPSADASDLASNFIFYGNPICGDPKGAPQPWTFSGAALTSTVASQRSGDGTVSLQVFNANCPLCTVRPNGGYWVRFFSRRAIDPTVSPKLVVTTLSAPSLYDAVPDATAGTTTVVGRLKARPSQPYTLHFYSSATCDSNGVLGGSRTSLGTTGVTTDANGQAYYSQSVATAAPSGSFVAASTQNAYGTESALSPCVPAPDNDTWPRAKPVQLTESTTLSGDADQSLDLDGQARWYRLDVQPNTKVTLDLSNLPANYDLFVFKDIGAALASATSTQDLLKLSAEFAGEATAPSAFSPSAFSPSAFSPSAFSPSAFSPSAFSPSAFSPSAFSPSAFSPSAFSPSAFSPSAFSPDAYSSAQVRSLIGASTNDGTAPESITLNSWNNTRLYIRVNGRLGASSAGSDYHLHVTADAGTCTGVVPYGTPPAAAPGQSLKTVILTDPSRMGGTATDKSTMVSKLTTLAGLPEVKGTIVDLSQDSRILALNGQADAHNGCPYAKNLLAGAIKDIVDSYRANNPGLAYVVLVGSDRVVPFFRYPDTAGLGPETGYVPPVLDSSASQASLRRDFVLSQDAYGAKTSISLPDGDFPIPDLAVGRLAESPSAVSTLLDAYPGKTGGVVPTPTSSLVTGYDFLSDAAQAVQGDFSAGLGSATGVRKDTLITNAGVPATDVGDPPTHSWDADRLRTQLLGSRHDLIFLAGHFSANNTLAADYQTTMTSSELAASSVNLTNSIVASAGCHSAYNIVDQDAVPGVTVPLDWAEAFAQKGATLIGGTGYQYGDTDFLEYSERLYADFSHQLRLGTGPVAVGAALTQAKQQYLAGTPVIRGIHEKALLEATLYGLPMLSVNLPAGRIPNPSSTSIVSTTNTFAADPGATLGLRYADVALTPTTTQLTKTLTNLAGGTTTATYLQGPDGVVTNPGEPALPVARNDVSVPGLVLRGVGFRGATFGPEQTGVTPLTGAATTEQQAVHTPFAPSVFFPSRLWSVNYFGALAGSGPTTLNVTPAQYKADGPGSVTDVLRPYTKLNLRLYYSNETGSRGPNTPALAAPPDIAGVEDSVAGSTVAFRVHAVGDPSAGMQQVWITYSGVDSGQWESLDLTQSADDSTLWTGTLTLPAGVQPGAVRYMVQAVDGVGLATLDDNFGAYYIPGQAAAAAPNPVKTSLSLVSPPTNGGYRTSATVKAQLNDAQGTPLAGKLISFTIGASTRTATTGSDGSATASVPLDDLPGSYRLTAAFGGDASYADASDARSGFTINPLRTTLTLPSTSRLTETEPGPTATLTAGGAALTQQTVLFVLKKSNGSVAASFARITDGNGRARIGVPDVPVPAGSYTVTAYFGGTVPLPSGPLTLGDPTPYTTATTANAQATVTVYVFTGFFSPVANVPVVNTVKAGSAVPVKFSLGYNAGLGIFASGYPRVTTIPCSASATLSPVKQTVSTTANSLTYDSTANQYNYTWKTDSTWAGTCRRLIVRFTNSADHIADFKLTN